MDERARGGDDADRAEHDRDLKQSLREVEIRVTLGGMFARGLELLGLGEQFFFAFAGRRVALIALDPLAIAFDSIFDLGPALLRASRATRGVPSSSCSAVSWYTVWRIFFA